MKSLERVLYGSLSFALAIVLLGSCASSKTLTSLDKEIKEIRPGILEGYIPMQEMPNSLLLVPPPPEEGSAAWALILTELFPDQTDVLAGRMMGAAAVARLHANTDFLIDMAAAKKELAELEDQGMQ